MRLMDDQLEIARDSNEGILLISDATGRGKSTEAINLIKYKVSKGLKVFVIGVDKACCENLITRLNGTTISYALFESQEDNARKAPMVNYELISDNCLKELLQEFYDEQHKLHYLVEMSKCNDEPQKEFIARQSKKLILKESITRQSEKLAKIKRNIRNTFIKTARKTKDKEEIEKIKKILKPLFPENINDYDVIFMTIDKFACKKLDTLDIKNRIIENKELDGKCCFIMDETDACYDRHCRIKARKALLLKDALAIIQLYYNQNRNEESRNFRKRFDQKFEEENMKDIKKIVGKIEETDREYHILKNLYVPEEVNSLKLFSDNKKSFALNNHTFGYAFSEENGTYTLKKNSKKTKSINIRKMMADITEILFGIFNQIYKEKNRIERTCGNWSEEEKFDHAISQVLNITSSDLKNEIIESAIDRQSDFRAIGSENTIKSVCTHGFRMLSFSNSEGYNHTHAEITDFSSTPENDILACAKKGLFVMMSATQQVRAIGNYRMQYFEDSLGENFHKVTKEAFDKVNETHLKEFENDNSIVAKEVSCGTVDEVLKKLRECGFDLSDTKTEELLIKFYEDSKRNNPGSEEYYAKKNMFKTFSLLYFLLEEDAKKGILMNNSSGKEYEEFFSQIKKEIDKSFENTGLSKTVIMYISAEDLKSKETVNRIHEESKKGNKVLVVSSKKTIGQSVNLQENEIEQNSNDFNFIYVEDPTFVNNNVLDGLPKEEITKEFYERIKMAEMENISEEELLGEKTLKTHASHHRKRGALFLQSVGRVWRTKNKEKKTFVFFDEALHSSISLLKNEEFEYTPLYIAALKAVEENNAKELVSEEAAKNNEFSNEYKCLLKKADIRYINGTNSATKKIKEIRNYLFTHGVYIPVDAYEDNDIFNMCYVKVTRSDCYYIDKTDNYCEDISCFLPSGNKNFTKLDYKDFSLKNGYKIPDEKECYVLLPKAFNILQGEVGERKFEEHFNKFSTRYYAKPLSDDEFEKCGDFKIYSRDNDVPTNVYVDVKNYSSSYSEKDVTDLIERKLSNIRSHNENGKIIILNFWANKDYKKVKSDSALIISDFIINGVINTKAFTEIENFIKQ